MMSGGDEVSAIVIDLGSHSCKAGYAGEDTPKAVFPSSFGYIKEKGSDDGKDNEGSEPQAKRQRSETSSGKDDGSADGGKTGGGGEGKRKLFVGSTALGYRRDHMEVASCMTDGVLSDWDAVTDIWSHAVRDRLLINPSEHAVLLAEPSFNPPAVREKTVELMFETLSPPALFLGRNAVLTAFSCGKSTSLVVDSGFSSTTVAGVHDGYVLQKSIVRSPVAGDALTELMLRCVGRDKVRPRYSFKRVPSQPGSFEIVDQPFPHTTDSYRLYMQKSIIADMKETICRVPDGPYSDDAFTSVPAVTYELPDGQLVEVGGDRFRVADALFSPQLLLYSGVEGTSTEDLPTAVKQAAESTSLQKMVVESIGRCDADIRKDLFGSILLSGGTMAMQQVKERVEREVVEEAPQAVKVKVLASGNPTERKFSVWIGGSILASLGSFQQLWLSKAEYEEHGPSFVHRKCP